MRSRTRREWLAALPFVGVHLAVFAALWTGVTWQAAVCCAVLYVVRMFAVTAGYHRYFSHRTYKTSRVGQFLLAFLAQTSLQKGALWWAAHHRDHHRWSDTERDVHSPVRRGFWYAHVGWLYDGTDATNYERVRDLAKFPELVWLNRYWGVPPLLLAAAVTLLFGWSGLVVGFLVSTVLVWHGTFCINSLAHVFGRRRFDTADQSRNNALLALITLGEGWHNNHHRFPSTVRQGFYRWELDVSWLVLKGLARLGLVWDLRDPPAHVLAEGRALDAARKRPETKAARPIAAEADPTV
jgi:stearoyl-CoA desaturase (delta-9 desaturase)